MKLFTKSGLAVCLALLMLCGCSSRSNSTYTISDVVLIPSADTASSFGPDNPPSADAAAFPVCQAVEHLPSADGKTVVGNESVTVDASNSDQGYIMVLYTGACTGKVKFRITGPDSRLYTYDLGGKSGYQTIPLTAGGGSYTLQAFEQAYGNEYYLVYSGSIYADIHNDFLPYLYPNQFVNFSENDKSTQIARSLAAVSADEISFIEYVYNYTMETITYDDYKAANVKAGYLPDNTATIDTASGICFDYASLMVSMLRSQNIPAKLVIGWSGNIYHAWINVYTESSGWINGIIRFDGSEWKLMDPTFADNANQADWIMQYIENTANYQEVYVY